MPHVDEQLAEAISNVFASEADNATTYSPLDGGSVLRIGICHPRRECPTRAEVMACVR
jgi:hypothetical protein